MTRRSGLTKKSLTQLASAIAFFQSTMAQLGTANNVTLFTASDFGRALLSNGDGCDHGWGAHHFVHGGAVRGGDLYGRFPTYGSDDGHGDFTSADQVGNGALLPAVSVDQYAATLARWFGVSDAQLQDILPNLANFDAGARNLGFMG